MKTKKILSVLGLSLSLLISIPAVMANEANETVVIERNQAVVQVNGVVCSFCAYGAEKELSKLSFLDKTQFGNDGVLVDIHTHRITLALQPSEQMNVTKIYDAIKKGGYDPTAVYVNIHGEVQQYGGRYLLTCPENNQVFEISGSGVDALVGKGLIQVKGQVDVEQIPSIKAGQPIPVTVTSLGMS